MRCSRHSLAECVSSRFRNAFHDVRLRVYVRVCECVVCKMLTIHACAGTLGAFACPEFASECGITVNALHACKTYTWRPIAWRA